MSRIAHKRIGQRFTIEQLKTRSMEAIESWLHSEGYFEPIKDFGTPYQRRIVRAAQEVIARHWMREHTMVTADTEHPDYDPDAEYAAGSIYAEQDWDEDENPYREATYEEVLEFVRDIDGVDGVEYFVKENCGRDTYYLETRMEMVVAYWTVEEVEGAMADCWLELNRAEGLNATFVALQKAMALQHHSANLLKDHTDIPYIVVRKIREHGMSSYIPPREVEAFIAAQGE